MEVKWPFRLTLIYILANSVYELNLEQGVALRIDYGMPELMFCRAEEFVIMECEMSHQHSNRRKGYIQTL
ncbi:hypothetical protein J6590_004729 [Homalodisca vitripennis]|nr:hypothetical protein J6590_004729 [Homalodisca vitripennis]